ncbi:DUF2726 domain-containing protein [Ruegeria sp.]|uniref:DUF2726 domain-containing protein n=1 Tax=Ruegeria sp. TaxID=1879320 RepID=UPI003B00B5C2
MTGLVDMLDSLPAGLLPGFMALLASGAGWIALAHRRRVAARAATRAHTGFVARAILNRQEAKLYRRIEARLPKGLRLMAQVCYGEMLCCRDRSRFLTINARRADLVVVDAGFNVVAVIEYQGRGHNGPTKSRSSRAGLRAGLGDRRKKAALEEAGLTLIAIPAEYDTRTIERAMDLILPKREARP